MANPTFPLDERALARKKRDVVAGSLWTWLPPLPIVAGWALFGLSGPLALLLLAVIGAGQWFFWKKQLGTLDKRWRREMVESSNSQQNKQLQQYAGKLLRKGRDEASAALQHAVRQKRFIEERIHEASVSADLKERLDTLVDTVCFSLLARLEQDPKLKDANTREAVERAKATLDETAAHLPQIIDPSHALQPKAPDGYALDQALEGLREEIAVAKAVKERLKADMSSLHGVMSSPNKPLKQSASLPRQSESEG